MRNLKLPKFTEEEQKAIAFAAYRAFDECAYDLFTAIAEEKHKNINQVSIRRSLAIEIGLDAGRAEEVLRAQKKWPPDFFERLSKASYRQLNHICKVYAFTCGEYSM